MIEAAHALSSKVRQTEEQNADELTSFNEEVKMRIDQLDEEREQAGSDLLGTNNEMVAEINSGLAQIKKQREYGESKHDGEVEDLLQKVERQIAQEKQQREDTVSALCRRLDQESARMKDLWKLQQRMREESTQSQQRAMLDLERSLKREIE